MFYLENRDFWSGSILKKSLSNKSRAKGLSYWMVPNFWPQVTQLTEKSSFFEIPLECDLKKHQIIYPEHEALLEEKDLNSMKSLK